MKTSRQVYDITLTRFERKLIDKVGEVYKQMEKDEDMGKIVKEMYKDEEVRK